MQEIKQLETLIYYDGPELISAKDAVGSLYLCLLNESRETNDIFICVPISKGRLSGLKLGQIDLKDIFESPEVPAYFEGEALDGNAGSLLIRQKELSELKGNWIPKPGLFLNLISQSDDFVHESAVKRNRAFITCSFNPPEAATETKISVFHLSRGLQLYQSMIRHALEKAFQKLSGALEQIFSLPENSTLEVLDFSDGSFTVNMQCAFPANLFGETFIEKGLELIDEVNFNLDDPEKATSVLAEYGGHFINSYKNMLEFIKENNMTFSSSWSSPSKKRSFTSTIIPRKAIPILEYLAKRKELSEVEIIIRGRFIDLGDNNNWKLRSTFDNKEYSGISIKPLDGITYKTADYELTCQESVEEIISTGKQKKKYTLRSFRLLEDSTDNTLSLINK